MICTLCFERGEDLIIFSNVEEKVGKIIYKYFPFCFQVESKNGLVCEKCWLKVEMFHEFFIRIEEIHSTLYKNENIFAEQLDIKNNSEETLIETLPLKNENENKSANDEQSLFNKNKNVGYCAQSIDDNFCNNSDGDDELKPEALLIKNEDVNPAYSEIEDSAFNDNNVSDDSDYFPTVAEIKKSMRKPKRRKPKKSSETIEQIVCSFCGKVYKSTYYKNHIQLEHTAHEKLKCDICGIWLKHRFSMVKHMKFRHIQKPETCSICGKVSPNKKALAEHKEIHLDTKERFKCIVCGKGFRNKFKLKEHSYIHSGITDAYRCNYCDKTFRFGSSWSAHRKKFHPAEEYARIYGDS